MALPPKSTLHDWLKRYDLSFVRKILRRILRKKQAKIMAVEANWF